MKKIATCKNQKFSLLYSGYLLTSESPAYSLKEAKKELSKAAKDEKAAAKRAYPKCRPKVHKGEMWATITLGSDIRSSLWTRISIVTA